MVDNRPIIGLDIDGVLAGFSQKFVELADRRFGLSLDLKNQTGWDFECLGLSTAQCNEIYEEIKNTFNFWEDLTVLPNTDALSEYFWRYKIYFITSRMYAPGFPLELQTAYWLCDNFLINNPTVIVSSRKGPLAAALNLEYFLDDKPENCLEVRAFSPFTHVFLQDAPYNRDFEQGSIERVHSVNEFFERIQGGHYGSKKVA